MQIVVASAMLMHACQPVRCACIQNGLGLLICMPIQSIEGSSAASRSSDLAWLSLFMSLDPCQTWSSWAHGAVHASACCRHHSQSILQGSVRAWFCMPETMSRQGVCTRSLELLSLCIYKQSSTSNLHKARANCGFK